MNKEKYISVEEAAKKWGKTARNVRLRCQKGHVPGATIEGRCWLIPADAVDPGQSTRRKVRAKSIWGVLKAEKRSGTKNGIYHRLQIDFAYNSNHMEGSRLTHEQTRWIFETKTIGSLGEDTPVDDVVETANHFRCLDIVIETAGAALTESYIKRLHAQLKSGTSDSRKAWFAVGEYKRLDNVVGERETCPASEVPRKMAALVRECERKNAGGHHRLPCEVRGDTSVPGRQWTRRAAFDAEGVPEERHHAVCHCRGAEKILLPRTRRMAAEPPRSADGCLPHWTRCVQDDHGKSDKTQKRRI